MTDIAFLFVAVIDTSHASRSDFRLWKQETDQRQSSKTQYIKLKTYIYNTTKQVYVHSVYAREALNNTEKSSQPKNWFSLWLRLSFQNHFGVESRLFVSSVSDDSAGTIRFVEGVFASDSIPFSRFVLVLLVPSFRVSHAILEFVSWWSLRKISVFVVVWLGTNSNT